MAHPDDVQRLVEKLRDIMQSHSHEMARLGNERARIVREAIHRIETAEVEGMKRRLEART